MPITFQQSASASASPNAAVTVTITAPAVNDLIIVAFGVGDSSATDSNISLTGYTEVADLFEGTDTNDTDLWVGYRYSDGTETAIGPFAALGGTNASNAAVAMVFSGVALAADGGPFDTAATTATGINSGSPDPPSIDHSGSAGVVTVIAGATAHAGGGLGSYTFPTGYTTNAISRPHDDNADLVIGMGYNTAPSDPENPGVMSGSNIGTAANDSWCAVTMALKEAPAAVQPVLRHGRLYRQLIAQ